jgi:hypothetical protein
MSARSADGRAPGTCARCGTADALGTELTGVRRVFAGVGVGTHRELALADLVGPLEDRLELRRRLRRRHRQLAEHDRTGRAVDRDPVALLDDGVADRELLALDAHGLGTDDGRGPPASGDHGGVADETATRGEDALRRHHAVDVVGARLVADEDHVLTLLPAASASSAVK